MSLIHFLLVFDHATQQLVVRRDFDNAGEAADAYTELEHAHRGEPNLEIVLIGADSIETIQKTHGNYFGRRSASPFLEAVS